MYKLLVADDERIERKVLCKTLQKYVGDLCEIYEAKNGKEAVEIFEKEKIQIAILDIEMPIMNGLEAARQMRCQNENCVLLFLTAYDEFSYAKQAISVHVLDYLLKPYEEKELIYAVEEAIRLTDKNEKIRSSGILQKIENSTEAKTNDTKLSSVKEMIEKYIEEHYAEEISMHELSEKMNYSETYFCKLFKQYFHVNFTTYLVGYRIQIAKEMLTNPIITIKDIGKACGYTDSNYFSRIFKRVVGCTPTEYRTRIMAEKKG